MLFATQRCISNDLFLTSSSSFGKAAATSFIIINTLPENQQECLIYNTIPFCLEEKIINGILEKGMGDVFSFIIYGKNDLDETVDKKKTQLFQLGLTNVYIYRGGMFEWCLLQDFFGEKEVRTTQKNQDLLKFKIPSLFVS